MKLSEQITSNLRDAMKARDTLTTSTLRMVQAAIKNAEVDRRHALEDDEVLEVLGREAKRRRESIASYTEAGRDDLVEREAAELAILETYLPAGLSEDEVAALVDAAIAETGATEAKQMGLVMKALMPKVQGRADGALVSALVKARLSG